MKVAVVYHTFDGHTREIAQRIAAVHESEGRTVDLFPVDHAPDCLLGYGAVIIGGAIHAGRHDKSLVEYVKRQAGDLSTVPSAFFSVSLSAAGFTEAERETADGYIREFTESCGWHPDFIGAFGGALLYTHYGFVKRKMMQFIAKRAGRPTDTKRDYDYTNWDSVEHFAHDIVQLSEARAEAQPAWA